MAHPTVSDLCIRAFKSFNDTRGTLVPVELHDVFPATVRRIFWIYGVTEGTTRGQHAHKLCQQLIFCCKGLIAIEVTDGQETRTFKLQAGDSLFVPALIYASERYIAPDSVLLVVCDQPYDAADYVTSIDELRKLRADLDTI